MSVVQLLEKENKNLKEKKKRYQQEYSNQLLSTESKTKIIRYDYVMIDDGKFLHKPLKCVKKI